MMAAACLAESDARSAGFAPEEAADQHHSRCVTGPTPGKAAGTIHTSSASEDALRQVAFRSPVRRHAIEPYPAPAPMPNDGILP
jgi:hypothetical protein